ncbi:MAG: L-threonylcarbamoyladenylate synthase [Candidatus Moranbacteria bacterium]|nr:L-threonylcarbamoyladenylate synthase [Candidatus Moranbacteria bacterium]
MNTQVIKIESNKDFTEKITRAAGIIKKGGLVAFPTETVYGLGANGLDENAVKKIFLAKGRPQDNPLILHVSSIKQAQSLAEEIPEKAEKLMNKFWPGPLTLILKRSKLVPNIIAGGLESVAIRIPENDIAIELIRRSGRPLAAPSANLSGKPSPTSASHVLDDLGGRIEAVIDGGETQIGIESTVVDLTGKNPAILRPGKITRSQLEKTIGKLNEKSPANLEKPKSPGMKYKHYAPEAKVLLVKNESETTEILEKFSRKKIRVLSYKNENEMAKNMFSDFRKSDATGYDLIIIKEVNDNNFGSAIMDRLRKASSE